MRSRGRSVGPFPAAAGLALAGLLAPALAGSPLFLFESGKPFLWPDGGRNIPFNPDRGGLGTLVNPDAVALTEDAFRAWQEVATSTVGYLNAGPLPVDVDETNFWPYLLAPEPDGLNAIVFDEDGSIFTLLFGPDAGVLGFAGPEWGEFSDGTILEGLAFINGEDIQEGSILLEAMFNTLVHEFGHFTNLAHAATNGEVAAFGDHTGPTPFDTFPRESLFLRVETMYPFLLLRSDGSPFGDDGTPHRDDIAILSTMYPEPDFFAEHGTITGTIRSLNGVTRITGVNVIARNLEDPFDDAVSALSGDFSALLTQFDPLTGVYTLNGLTPGATYAVYVDGILGGEFSTPPVFRMPGPEEFYNGPDESALSDTDDPAAFTGVPSVGGLPTTGIDVIFNAPRPGDLLPLHDDDYLELLIPFPFSFCGADYISLFANSNGSVSFGRGSNDPTPSVLDFLGGPPRISAFWNDLNPGPRGEVTFDQTENSFTVYWNDVPESPATGTHTFSVTLHRSSDKIDVTWDELTASGGLVGLSCGRELTLGREDPADLSELAAGSRDGTIGSRHSPAVYELWIAPETADLAGSSMTFSAPKGFVDRNEPNDTLADATRVSLPFRSGAPIGNSSKHRFTDVHPIGDDIDFFEFEAEAGGTLIAEVHGNGTFDSLLGLFDAATGELLATDDDGGEFLLSKLVHPLLADGTYAVAVTNFFDPDFTGAGVDSGRFDLELKTVEGIVLDLGDNDTFEVPFGDFAFPFQGALWNSVFVNSNGNLTFGVGDLDHTESIAEFLDGPPRIAPLWDDLNPDFGGRVLVDRGADSLTVRFEEVPEFFNTGTYTFSVTLNADGTIEMVYGELTTIDALVGVTEGGGAANPGRTNLSAASSLSVTGTTYERFGPARQVDLSFLTLSFQ